MCIVVWCLCAHSSHSHCSGGYDCCWCRQEGAVGLLTFRHDDRRMVMGKDDDHTYVGYWRRYFSQGDSVALVGATVDFEL